MSRIYAVGIGPGDPELLTRKTERIIRSVPVVCAPTGATEAASYALSVVEHLLDRSRQEVLVQVFPMTRDGAELEAAWQEAAAMVLARVREGREVAFITLGDPFLYSTFLYLHRFVREWAPEVPVEIIPGVSSITAAAAAAGIPLGQGSERLAILPSAYTDDELRGYLRDFDTVVLLKVARMFDRVYGILRELGLERNAVFVRRVGSAVEEVVFDLNRLVGKDLDYLSLLIIRKDSEGFAPAKEVS